jgi:hypothetical protein
MSQLCFSANQYGRQQSCEYGRMSTVCPFCVKAQTQQTDFFHHLNHLQTGCLINSNWETSELIFFIASLRIDEWWISSQNHNLANLFVVVLSTNSISSRGQKPHFGLELQQY